jgi:uncharacterized protein (TIGR02453 family)
MAKAAYFTPDLLRFLSELASHNNREWFQENKERYEESVRDPFLRFIADLQPRLKKISPHIVADPRPVGGSMMRIYRDTRFSKNKSPYKTAVMAHFWHDKGKEGATPAFYLRIQPGDSIAGAGIWHPEPGALKRIRQAIVEDSKTWKRIKEGQELRSGCSMAGESLKRPPQGFAADHPFIEDLKRKDFATMTRLDDRRIASTSFLDELVDAFKTGSPFIKFVSKAVGLPF